MIWMLVLIIGLIAGTVGGLIGFGSSIMLMPALVFALGPKAAVPVMAIAGLMANASRVAVWWREVDWKAALAYSSTAVPAGALGAMTLVRLDAQKVELALGAFLLAMIPIRRWLLSRGFTINRWQLAIVGAVIGFLSGIVATVGPINTPFFLAYGLTKGPYVSTEALGSALVGVSKAVTFRTFDALPAEIIATGLMVGGSVTVGSWLSKQLMHRVTTEQFRGLMDGVLFVAGLLLLWGAFRS